MDKDRFEAGRMRLWLRQTFFLLIHIKCRTCLSEVNMTNFTSIVIYNTHTTKRSVKIKFELLEISDLQVFLALLVIWFCSGNLTFESSDFGISNNREKVVSTFNFALSHSCDRVEWKAAVYAYVHAHIWKNQRWNCSAETCSSLSHIILVQVEIGFFLKEFSDYYGND